MQRSIDLLNVALKKHKASEWARRYEITPGTFTNAKNAGRLSPVLAGNLAIDLGEDVAKWIAIAAIETERASPLQKRLRRNLTTSYDSQKG